MNFDIGEWLLSNPVGIFAFIFLCMAVFGIFAYLSERKTHRLFPDQEKRGEREIRRQKEEEMQQGAGAIPGAYEPGDTGAPMKKSRMKRRQKKEATMAKTESTPVMPGNGVWATANNVGPKPVAVSYTAADGSVATQTVDPDGTIIAHFYTGELLNHLPIDEYVTDNGEIVKAMAFSYQLGDGGIATQTIGADGTITVHYYEGQTLVERAVSQYVARDGSLIDAPIPAPPAQITTGESSESGYPIGEKITSLWDENSSELSSFVGIFKDLAVEMKATGVELKEALTTPVATKDASAKAATTTAESPVAEHVIAETPEQPTPSIMAEEPAPVESAEPASPQTPKTAAKTRSTSATKTRSAAKPKTTSSESSSTTKPKASVPRTRKPAVKKPAEESTEIDT